MPSRISLKVGAIFFGFLLLALTEGIIRLTGIWENHPNPVSLPVNWADGHLPSAGRLTAPLLVEEGKEVITSTQLKPFMPTRKFKKSKKPTTKRIFSFGGSSTLGVPVEATPAKTFPGQLQLQLQSLGINAESINLGGASFSSDHVKQLAIESLNYEPDALIIYSGNNEYFQYMLELSAINPTWEPQNLYLEKLHLFRAVASIFTDKKESTELYESQKKQETLLLQQAIAQFGSVSENPFVRTDRITTQVNQRYIANLKQVLQTAKLQKVPVFIVLIPANLLHPPELSLHNPNLSGKERKKWQSQYDKAKKTDCGDAISLWTEVIQIDPWFAEAWYQRGICKRKRNEPAKEDLLNALNLDMNPNRPPSSLHNQILSLDTFLISVEEKFSVNYGDGMFHDSCHLTPKGYEQLAESVVQSLISQLGWGLQ